ncbi:hypothetical protein A9G12_09045 [Gilliamella sp. wkB112]|nr:hypothetical protein A9G12_09045 [Gilliamella apicola]
MVVSFKLAILLHPYKQGLVLIPVFQFPYLYLSVKMFPMDYMFQYKNKLIPKAQTLQSHTQQEQLNIEIYISLQIS